MGASITPTSPPQRTSLSWRALIPKSAPAAPAVAKKPMTAAMTAVSATNGSACAAGGWYGAPAGTWKNTTINISSGMKFRNVDTLATY